MARQGIEIDPGALDAEGYVVVPDVLDDAELARFEQEIETFCATQIEKRRVERRHRDALHDLMLSGQGYREALFPQLKYLRIVQRWASEIGDRLETGGMFARWGFGTPLVWPTLRVDLPNESTYLLPMHQDFKTTKCRKALRMWVPLRDADAQFGTMCVVPGSHKAGAVPHDERQAQGPSVPESVYAGSPVRTLEMTAGSGVLFSPYLIHGSVMNRSQRLKFVLLLQIQDLATLFDPDDAEDSDGRRFLEVASSAESAG